MLYEYVPRKLVFELDEDLVSSSVGSQALGGYVAVDIAYTTDTNPSNIMSSYLLIFDLYGSLHRVEPTYFDGAQYRPLGLKLKNSTHLLVAAGKNEDMVGYRLLYGLETEEWTFIAGDEKGDAHDIQWAYSGNSLWQPTLSQFDAATGERLTDTTVQNTGDVNHCQPIEEDKKAMNVSEAALSKMDAGGELLAFVDFCEPVQEEG